VSLEALIVTLMTSRQQRRNDRRCPDGRPLTTTPACVWQRGIPPAALDVLLDWDARYDHRGCRIVALRRANPPRAARMLGDTYRRIERWLDAHAVIGPDARW
jgi:hypothetical protein